MADDYQSRNYLAASEVAAHTGLSVDAVHRLVRSGELAAFKSAGGQYRFRIADVDALRAQRAPSDAASSPAASEAPIMPAATVAPIAPVAVVERGGATQRIVNGDARDMSLVPDDSVHLAVTSPPYFNAKMYTESHPADLGDMHDLDDWLAQIALVWAEVFRALQPGRKFFLNIMNLPVRENGTFRSLNLVGKSVDACERAGFVFKRDIVWHKTNGVRAHFGTYPYPGGILINNMHESILEFEKPAPKGRRKYAHVTDEQRERSKLDKEFWLSLKNSDVWLIHPEKSGGGRSHAAPFPLEIPSRLARAYSFVGETVLDPFLGSGTTLVAAAQHGRNGIGYEINPDFCAIAARRLREAMVYDVVVA